MSISHNESALSTRSTDRAPVAAYPLVIAEWERNSRETVRVAIDQYNGRHTVNARIWYRDGNDEMRPGKTGLTLSVKHLACLAEAMSKALEEARGLGLIEGDQ
ncbi:transcriptional coactivator p15/PC4 family protein [Rhizobium sp. LjRoot30]|uniref:transcriptional coactivator p15/PC4 family protein n=1 Tax=Rhizobium sp. LjRoot30 TaxID=3342320 RepID=UPI003ECE58D6